METEIWKDIPGYEGKYQASTLGRIKSLVRIINGRNQFGDYEWVSKERLLRPGRSDVCGHLSVVLNSPRKSYQVHQLVMLTFTGSIPDGLDICHNNCDASDNRLSNLRFDTRRENVMDVYRIGRAWKSLTKDDAEAIKFGLACGMTCAELGNMYQVSHQTISKIKRGITFAWVP